MLFLLCARLFLWPELDPESKSQPFFFSGIRKVLSYVAPFSPQGPRLAVQ